MELRKREEALQMKLCEPCKMAKLIHHVRKTVHPECCVLCIFDQIHANMVKIKPVGYNKHIYGLILMDGAMKVRWAYTFEHKGNAFKCITKFIQFVKTQWGFTIKSWCIDSGKEYGVNNLK